MTTIHSWSRSCPNAAAALVAQAGIPVLIEGPPGVAKSSVVTQWSHLMDRDLMYLIGSTHAPEDFGGIPFPNDDRSSFTMTPPRWAERLTRPRAMLLLDELTCVPPSVRAAMLSMLTERRLGDVQIHADTLFFAACNPSSMAPNASPLEKSMANRFWHWEWRNDFEAWSTGMMSEDDNFQPRWVPKVAADWKRFKPMIGANLVSYCRRNSNERIAVPKDDTEMAYPTPRSWKYLRDALAAAESVDTPSDVRRDICIGMVGKTTGRNVMQFLSQLDLVDPEEVLAGRKEFRHDKRRADLTVTLMTSIVTAIKSHYTEERMDAAIALFCTTIGKDAADLTLTQLRHLAEARPKGERLSKQSLAVIKQFGDRIPEPLRQRKAG